MILEPQFQKKICTLHNLEEMYENPDKSNPDKKLACNICIEKLFCLKPIVASQEILKQFENQHDKNSTNLNHLLNSLTNLKINYQKAIEIISEIMNSIKEQLVEMQNVMSSIKNELNQKSIEELKKNFVKIKDDQGKFQQNIKQKIQILKQNHGVPQTIQKLGFPEIEIENNKQHNFFKQNLEDDRIDTQQNGNLLQEQENNNPLLNNQVIRYFQNSVIKQNEWCQAISFNKDASIIAAGCNQNIRVFQLKCNELNEIQLLKGHNSCIMCLQFMKKSNQLISGSLDGQIKIWIFQNTHEWFNIQTLSVHNKQINCIIINIQEDQLISGSDDKSIIIWQLNNNKWNQFQKIDCLDCILSLSLSDSNKRLISCVGQTVQIFEWIENKWDNIQSIDIDGIRLNFIDEQQFILKTQSDQILRFYNFQNKQFQQQYETIGQNDNICDEVGFPIIYIKSKNLLIVKNNKYVNILSKQENEQFILDQSIEFSTNFLYGNVSDDGQYLITWDFNSKEFQVRILK